MKIAFFDFDGTITKKDSTIGFIRFFVGDLKFIFGIIILLPLLILYKVNILSNNYIKIIIVTFFFKGTKKLDFERKASIYSRQILHKLIRKKALDKLNWHKKRGHTIVIVSASINAWLQDWCDSNNFSLIATELEIVNERITGRLLPNNCYGPEKVIRILKKYNLSDYDYIYAYGNSRGDYEMLDIANEKHYKPFT
ncbi:MAG: HAD-IB family hydrolase [Gammaproteobacteria bacterium]|jgi:phosphatidylglycerophosphatase C|nr:HAD-IB family hydrolase [Gammaproteobacteria bacterium]MBT4462983.1 HAD-IB family hydrolase [Gammaproteobacteria bacterium]MBT4654594.1 HAD-IB family hydrolase [Gammaproteobacteria bacterium]MBT5117095.1 HAD-IB family hydrolase [Gammaproteobacteria bacterium]MBT5761280.1 HAD-IB family hydrolase [Gammaproteobacteria bacterium]